MDELGVKIIVITSMNPIFKGIATLLVGIVGFLFCFAMRKFKNEPDTFGFRIFYGLSIFIIVYGLFILIFRPNFWLPPYPLDFDLNP